MRVSLAYAGAAMVLLAAALVLPFGAEATRSVSSEACSATVHHDVLPVWMRAGFSGTKPRIPYVVGERGLIGGVLFGSPLNAPPAQHKNNKILWVPRRVSQECCRSVDSPAEDGRHYAHWSAGSPGRRTRTRPLVRRCSVSGLLALDAYVVRASRHARLGVCSPDELKIVSEKISIRRASRLRRSRRRARGGSG